MLWASVSPALTFNHLHSAGLGVSARPGAPAWTGALRMRVTEALEEGAGVRGGGAGSGFPRPNVPGSEHVGSRSLLPQLTHFLPSSGRPGPPLGQEPAQPVPGAEPTTSAPGGVDGLTHTQLSSPLLTRGAFMGDKGRGWQSPKPRTKEVRMEASQRRITHQSQLPDK